MSTLFNSSKWLTVKISSGAVPWWPSGQGRYSTAQEIRDSNPGPRFEYKFNLVLVCGQVNGSNQHTKLKIEKDAFSSRVSERGRANGSNQSTV